MAGKKCPTCGCKVLYVKDPDDAFETYEFECRDGKICFDPDVDAAVVPEISSGTETYCTKCSWHDKFNKLDQEA